MIATLNQVVNTLSTTGSQTKGNQLLVILYLTMNLVFYSTHTQERQVLFWLNCFFVPSQSQRGACTVPPPQEHVEQAFIPDRISRTEVRQLSFSVFTMFQRGLNFKRHNNKSVAMEFFIHAFDVQQSRKHEVKGT